MTARDAGYYWVRRGAGMSAEVARWNGRAWYFPTEAGGPFPEDAGVEVLGGPMLNAGGEPRVTWRGIVRDLYNDLMPLLSPEQREELGRLLLGREGIVDHRLSGTRQNPAQPPIAMLLHCPMCSERHFDEGEFATKPHHTHACQVCGHVWRPAVVPTVGVRFLPGFKNPCTKQPVTLSGSSREPGAGSREPSS